MIRLVIYDLKGDAAREKEERLHEVIKNHHWCRVARSAYVLKTSATPKELYEKLKLLVEPEDILLVFSINEPWSGQRAEHVLYCLELMFSGKL